MKDNSSKDTEEFILTWSVIGPPKTIGNINQ